MDVTAPEVREKIEEVAGTELPKLNYSLMDAMLEGSQVTGQQTSRWANDSGSDMCALSAGVLAATARGYLE